MFLTSISKRKSAVGTERSGIVNKLKWVSLRGYNVDLLCDISFLSFKRLCFSVFPLACGHKNTRGSFVMIGPRYIQRRPPSRYNSVWHTLSVCAQIPSICLSLGSVLAHISCRVCNPRAAAAF